MKHFLQYHNVDKIGSLEDYQSDQFYILSNKSVQAAIGNRVWLIAGEGTPRNYTLCSTFIADEATSAVHPYFSNKLVGSAGIRFQPVIDITQFPWFKKLKHDMVNFSLGFREIKDEEIIEILVDLMNNR